LRNTGAADNEAVIVPFGLREDCTNVDDGAGSAAEGVGAPGCGAGGSTTAGTAGAGPGGGGVDTAAGTGPDPGGPGNGINGVLASGAARPGAGAGAGSVDAAPAGAAGITEALNMMAVNTAAIVTEWAANRDAGPR
jgi:hypothetical protein